MLEGQPASPDLFRQVAAKVFAEAKGYGEGSLHNSFKIELGKRAIVRALKQAVEMDYVLNPNAYLNSNP